MAKLIYRVVSACGMPGDGFPRESLQKALLGRIDAVVSNAGSTYADPYRLGSGGQYFEPDAVKNDFRKMVEAGEHIEGPVILGTRGVAGGDRNLNGMLEVAKEVFEELDVCDTKVAVIRSEVDPAVVIDVLHASALRPVGTAPALDEAVLRESTIVGQMGIHPLLAALDGGAKYVFAGRSCGAALFAADMIRHGIAPGLAYHVGQVLKCGALACDPPSSSDCLVAEVYDDGSARFVAPDQNRRVTPHSIAAHSLYEQAHPHLQFYPEGVLAMARTEFFAVDTRTAGIRKSRFYRIGRARPLSVRLEGLRRVGLRNKSLVQLDPADLLHTVDRHADALARRHRAEIGGMGSVASMGTGSLLDMDATDTYEWTLYHLLQNEDVIRDRMFPIHHFRANGPEWSKTGETRAEYFDVGEPAGAQNLDDRTLSVIEDVAPHGPPCGSRRLLDMARVIRSRNAGVNLLTLDVLFVSKDAYEAALRSNFFCARNVADKLGFELAAVVGTYFVDNCNAIKITVDRPIILASPDDRDMFGAQQQAMLERMVLPMYSDVL